MVNIDNNISHGKGNSTPGYQQRAEIMSIFKPEKDCDREFFCSNSFSLHLGRIKMSLSEFLFLNGRVI